jgi:hypothetical protein
MSLTLHAKVYFSAASYNGSGDEFYFDVPPSYGAISRSIDVRSTSWEPSPDLGEGAARVIYQPTALGGTAEVGVSLNYCGAAPELIGSTLEMGTTISWWGSFPSGLDSSITWSSKLKNARCVITGTTV